MRSCLNCYHFVFEYDLDENDDGGWYELLHCHCNRYHWELQTPQYADTFRATLKAAETCKDYTETP